MALQSLRAALLALLLALSAGLSAAPLASPKGLSVTATEKPLVQWQPVDGAVAYRVAFFDVPDLEGKRPLLAAVWVKGTSWSYGSADVIAKVGAMASTAPASLPHGRPLRVMVAAVREDGSDKSDWAGADLLLVDDVKAPVAATPVAEPTSAELAADAELEIEVGEF